MPHTFQQFYLNLAIFHPPRHSSIVLHYQFIRDTSILRGYSRELVTLPSLREFKKCSRRLSICRSLACQLKITFQLDLFRWFECKKKNIPFLIKQFSSQTLKLIYKTKIYLIYSRWCLLIYQSCKFSVNCARKYAGIKLKHLYICSCAIGLHHL